MWFSLLMVVLILAIAFFQSTQGLFSALITCVLTICCAAVALGTYEWVSMHWLAPHWKPDYAAGIALAALFGVPLLVLRLATDQLIRRAGLLPLWVERAGAGVCGLVTAMITVGMLSNSLLALPFGTSVMGFSRVDVADRTSRPNMPNPTPPDPDAKIREIWFKPDRFVMTLAGLLSNGIFSGKQSLWEAHPDPIEATAWVNAVPPGVTRFAPPGSISVVGTELVQFVYSEIPGTPGRRGEAQATSFETLAPKAGNQFRVVRIKLKNEARGSAKSHTFTPRQIRLVGRQGDEARSQYHAMAIEQAQSEAPQTVKRHVKSRRYQTTEWPILDQPVIPRDDNNDEVEVVFEVPSDLIPEFVEYKRGARAAVPLEEKRPPAETKPAAEPSSSGSSSKPPTTAGGTVPSSGQGGNVRRYTTRSGASFFGEQLPITLKAYQKPKPPEMQRDAMASGHLVAFVDEQESGTDTPVAKFQVNPDLRLLQLNTGYLKAKSTLGKALSFAVETLQNFSVEDSDGKVYEIMGKYAIADVDGRQVIEVQYFSERAGSIGQLGPFRKIKDSHLKGDYELVLLFLVDPGVRITAFSTGGAATRRDDLSSENLVAPN